MLNILAQATEASQGIPVSYVLTALGVMTTGGVAVVGFLWTWFRKHFLNLEKRVVTLEKVAASSSGFISGVCGAAMMGPQVPSALIYDLHEQHKPADSSGIHKSLPKPGKYNP